MKDPVLVIGGSGIVGRYFAKALRKLQPALPIAIGGRDLAKAKAVAEEAGLAEAVRVDLERSDLGLPEGKAYSAVVVLLKDATLNTMKYAQAKGLPYVSFSDWLFDIGPEVARYVHAPSRAPVLFLGHALGGTVTLSTLHFARDFRTIESIDLGVVVGEGDSGGPAAQVDMDRLGGAVARPPILKNGQWLWAGEEDALRRFTGADGREWQGRALPLLDVASLAAATDTQAVRIDFAVRPGDGLAHEVLIEITGTKTDGSSGRFRYALLDAASHSETSARGVALAVERLLGLAGGAAVAPGLYHPESLLHPGYVVERMQEFGTRIERGH
ncbi:NAD(P)-dependent oxidoreductase [Pendulispora rubella]|uniref:NAD(P)-dependent oxidoreductase n=1 Tax=Pendulispora rubella TaxID=2741070 RepID=A0ABZ2KUI2_9BACT